MLTEIFLLFSMFKASPYPITGTILAYIVTNATIAVVFWVYFKLGKGIFNDAQ